MVANLFSTCFKAGRRMGLLSELVSMQGSRVVRLEH